MLLFQIFLFVLVWPTLNVTRYNKLILVAVSGRKIVVKGILKQFTEGTLFRHCHIGEEIDIVK